MNPMSPPLQSESPQDYPLVPQAAPRLDHISRARKLLAEELRSHWDSELDERSLKPIADLPPEYQGDSCNVSFGFSVGTGSTKKVFAIRFQLDRGNPIFELNPVEDPSLSRLRLTGQLSSLDKGRCQIERILGQR